MFSIYLTYFVPKYDFSQISHKLLGHFLPVTLGRNLFLLLGPEGSDHFLSVLAPKSFCFSPYLHPGIPYLTYFIKPLSLIFHTLPQD